ncbi:unnamed protein product [Macrosiphum euphorbiae]|uniref:Reverse transcriptase domain-containing protein n=1 Tax=Macrosiphum euphorbiae TaxID=13131 RepID=A0AAV0XRF4_9HEMI|nr:unnamed protein product [Macrosiphum euphorbiae]
MNCFKARRDSWRSFVTDIGNREPWGPVYTWLKTGGLRPSQNLPVPISRANGTFTDSLEETGIRLIETLVPGDTSDGESPEQTATRAETGVKVGHFGPETGEDEPANLCDVEEVKRAIWRMDPKKSPGADGITTRILCQAWPVLAEHITNLFNICLKSKKFPSAWKLARLVVILKSPGKDRAEAKSYRPISLLPMVSKALEHIIIDRIRADTDPYMSQRQFGFTKNLSTVDVMHHALNWTKSRQEKYVFAVFLDISGAFDCLWWAQLVADMRSAGCRSGLVELTKSYLDGRRTDLNGRPDSGQNHY